MVSTVTLQSICDVANSFGDIEPVLNVGGSSAQPALTIANDVMSAICAVPFPHKWNELILPYFYTNSLQQDYALIYPDGNSVTTLSWLERGIVINMSNSEPKISRPVEVGRQLPQATGGWMNTATSGIMYLANWFPNKSLYYGTWGESDFGNATQGNNPIAGSVYTNPLGAGSMPDNPLIQIRDDNDNLLVLTGYGTEGVVAPVAAVDAAAGAIGTPVLILTQVAVAGPVTTYTGTITGGSADAFVGLTFTIAGFLTVGNNVQITVTASTTTTLVCVTSTQVNETHAATALDDSATTVWTVVDPNGQGIRILPVPSTTGAVWQFNLVGQKRPVRFTNLQQTLDPLPDEFEPHFRAGFIAQCYRYSVETKVRQKFPSEWAIWMQNLYELRAKQDREQEENTFVPERGVMGGSGRSRGATSAWPFRGPSPY
jgi:hypothetical protein